MSIQNLTRMSEPGSMSMIGGAANGGSVKPKEEREKLDREHQHQQSESPAGAGSASSAGGSVGGLSNDQRTDEQRSSGGSS